MPPSTAVYLSLYIPIRDARLHLPLYARLDNCDGGSSAFRTSKEGVAWLRMHGCDYYAAVRWTIGRPCSWQTHHCQNQPYQAFVQYKLYYTCSVPLREGG